MAKGRKKCGSGVCKNEIPRKFYFCTERMNRVPPDMKRAFYGAYAMVDGRKIIELSAQIRAFLKEKGNVHTEKQKTRQVSYWYGDDR